MSIRIGETQAQELLEKGLPAALSLMEREEDVAQLLRDTEALFAQVGAVRVALPELPGMIALVGAYYLGETPERRLLGDAVSRETVAAAVSALLYFRKSKDLIPDDLSAIGFADDLPILNRALRLTADARARFIHLP